MQLVSADGKKTQFKTVAAVIFDGGSPPPQNVNIKKVHFLGLSLGC